MISYQSLFARALCGVFICIFAALSRLAAAGEVAPGHVIEFPATSPIVPATKEWTFNDYWRTRQIGPREFYAAAQGPYFWLKDESMARLKQVGLLDRVTPGHINFSYIKYFLPEEREKLKPDAPMRRMVEAFLENKWPIHTIFYHRFKGNPPPSKRLLDIFGDRWIGDGQPETVYRLEPVFHYVKTGKRWVGSSMGHWTPEVAIEFFKNDLLPRLEKELPFIRDLDHKWTRPQLRRLSDLYCEEFYRPMGRKLSWGMYVGSYHMASLPNTNSVAEKGADAFSAARLRGMSRQFGGNKFLFVWRGHEPTEMYAYIRRAWYTTRGDEWGLPLPHIWYYLYRPYLIGANYYVNEGIPGNCIQDVEDDGQIELSTLGYIYKDMLDFVDRHPDRGTVYTPIALMLDYNRAFGSQGTTYTGYNLPNDDADFFNQGIFQLVFPGHRHAPGGYSRTSPFGEIFDILQPNVPGKGADPKALANYKVLFALGGMTFDADFAGKVIEHVRNGGTLVLHAADVTPHLPAEFLGLEVTTATVPGENIICTLDEHISRENPYDLHTVKLSTAQALFKDGSEKPVVTRNRFGRGHVIVLMPHYAIEKEGRRMVPAGGFPHWNKSLARFVPHLFEHLSAGVSPFEVRCRPEDRPDLSWIISRKGEGWVISMFNYSCARESIVVKRYGTDKVHANYPLKEVPFQVVCRAPVSDVVEWHGDRDVNWKASAGTAVISETMHGGEIRVYELQPEKIDLGLRTRFVNHALNRPVTASSFRKGYEPELAVNGNLGRFDYWWSDTDPRRHYVFDMPQWLRVDLGEVRTIDHAFVLFNYWEQESLKTRLRVIKYIVEASLDGEKWTTVMAESRNEDNMRPEGTERWFDPIKARYVRLTVLRNSAFGGARVIELKIMGTEKEQYKARRKSIIPDWEVQYPVSVRDIPDSKVVHLIDIKPARAVPGWLPAGKKWADMNGPVKLMTTRSGLGRFYPKSIYAQAHSEIEYALDGRFTNFVAAIGIGASKSDCSVEFQVFIDGQKKFASGLYRLGRPVLPVVVDVTGAKKLKLVVTDGGDSIRNDYAWWGEARLVKR